MNAANSQIEPSEKIAPILGFSHLSDPDLERRLLAAIIKHDLQVAINPKDFSDYGNEILAGFVVDLRKKPGPLTMTEFQAVARDIKGMEQIPIVNAIAAAEPCDNPEAAVRILRDLTTRRRLSALGRVIEEVAQGQAHSVPQILAHLRKELDQFEDQTDKGRTQQFGEEAAHSFLDSIGKPSLKVKTGLASVDKKLAGGFRRGQMSIIAGRASMGKTAVVVALGSGAARACFNVLYVSLEMTRAQLGARIASEVAFKSGKSLPYADMEEDLDGKTEEIVELFRLVDTQFPRGMFLIDDASGLTIDDIATRARRRNADLEKQGKALDLVIVDHLGIVTPSGRYKGNRVQEIGEISAGLVNLAKSENVAVLALSQLSRQVESRENKRPLMSDLRDSGSLEQDAETVLLCYRESYYLEREKGKDTEGELKRLAALDAAKNKLELNVAKARSGSAGVIDLFADMPHNHIADLAHHGGGRP